MNLNLNVDNNLQNKLKQLTDFFKNKKVVVAFSGGVDSGVLAYLSNKYAKETLLITEKSILYPEDEIKEAKMFAKKYNIPHKIIERDPLEHELFRKNPLNRCYICKKGLYEDIKKIAASKGFDIIIDGTNIDDLSDYRPGLDALKELEIEMPYIKFKINKNEIRKIAELFNLEIELKPSMACFSSRIPYNQEITEEKLERIQKAEQYLKKTFNLSQLRVRYHENDLARIEILPEEFNIILNKAAFSQICQELKNLGFNYITLDMEGYRSGSMNEPLKI
ncbi:MAG: ATP-dependent sacrificial sulfur transferase LarE [Promethearchaeia archaeon]